MRKMTLALGLILAVGAAAEDKPSAPPSPQVERGKALFAASTKGTACGTCHEMGGVGNAVGPDLKKIAEAVGPRGIVTTIQMSITAYVQEYHTKAGTFPGFAKEGTSGSEIWDLSKIPPVLHTFKSGEISSVKANEKWKHPGATADYSSQELADIISFLKWASTGKVLAIKPADIQ